MTTTIAPPGSTVGDLGTDAGSRAGWALPSVFVAAVLAVIALAAVHLTQGTAAVGLGDLVALTTGGGTDESAAVLVASRLPRLVAGLLVGVSLGAAGIAMQSATRNVLASPDTLAVNAGAHFAIVAVAAFGVSLPFFASGLVAFVGGLAAAAVVLALSGGGGGTIRLILAGSAIALGLSSFTTMLLLLFPQESAGLFAWGGGSLGQIGLESAARMAPVVVVALVALMLLTRRLDILALGDDSARVVGVDPVATRRIAVTIAVLLSAATVTVAGPIGFVGLCAPAIVRMLAPRVRGLSRHRALVPASALTGVIIVLGADVGIRALFGAQAGVEVPTGVVTTLLGAAFLVVIAFRLRDRGSTPTSVGLATMRSRRRFVVVLVVLVAVAVTVTVAALLLGDAKLLLGDLANWLTGRAGDTLGYILDSRMPRVLAALLAGAALALAGAIVQAVSRNALAEPGILGVVGGAGLAAIAVITAVPLASAWLVTGSALAGAAVSAALVFGLAARGGLGQNRLVLIGIGVSYGTLAVITMLIVLTDPYNQTKALTWLSGSTYGRSIESTVPLLTAVAIAVPVALMLRRRLDLLSLDDDTPRLLGLSLGRSRLALLSIAVVLTATAVASVGVIAFVGLVAPHAARALVGSRHSRVIPIALLLGVVLVSVADTLGRTLIAPGQLPAGTVTALVGTPYFVWLLWRSRASRQY